MSFLSDQKICFIGGGAIAEAIIRGLVNGNKIKPESIAVIDNGPTGRTEYLQNKYGITPVSKSDSIPDAIQAANVILLAVKPKDAADAIRSYRSSISKDQVIVSVVAGLSIESIVKLVEFAVPVVRTMPNTSASIGLAATGISRNSEVNPAQMQVAKEIFEAIGIVCEVEEQKLDIVTGVSGSGPAYIYYIVESMTAGGVAGGLDDETSRILTIQTLLGAAEMLRQTGEDPAELRRKVTSPNGTTQAALELLADAGVGDSVTKAVLRAAERAEEMGAEIAKQIEANA